MGLLFSPLAAIDLEEIGDHIARDNPHRAWTFIRSLRDQCTKISRAPLAYRARPELGDGIRCCAHGNYVILYRPEASGVLIIRVLHGAMDLPRHMGAQGTATRDGDEPDPEATADIEAGKPK